MIEALWYLSRGTGLTALVLFSLAVCLGVLTRSGRPVPLVGRLGAADVHRTAALTATALTVVHVATLMFDPYAQLRLVDLVVPGLGTYRPLYLAMGTLAVDLLLVVTTVSLLRHKVGPRVFTVVHYAVYAMWPLAVLHGIGTGTDSGQPWAVALTAVCTGLVTAAVGWRVTPSFTGRGRTRAPRAIAPRTPTREAVTR